MDVKELRVGNLLYNDNVVVTIDARTIFDIWDKSDKYNPIPLTEERLVRLGYKICEESDITQYYIGFDWDGEDYNDVSIISLDADGVWYITLGGRKVEVRTVHHLQNIIYDIYGVELTM